MFTLEHLQDLVEQVCDQMGFYSTPKVVINNRFSTRTLARASWGVEGDKIEFNKITLEFNVDELVDLIKHEVMHLILREGDSSIAFQVACRLSGISLSNEKTYSKEPVRVYKYALICDACKLTLKRYQKFSGYAKKVSQNSEYYSCPKCNEVGRLYIRNLS